MDVTRNADMMMAENTINALNNQLANAKTLLQKYHLTFEVELKSDFSIKVKVMRLDGKGFIKTISVDDIKYYASDIESLINQLVDDTVDTLVKTQIKNDLSPGLTRAVLNSLKVLGK